MIMSGHACRLCKSFLVVLLISLTAGASFGWAQSVTFVQFTDAHLFDSAKHRSTQAGFEDYLDNRSSLAWAVRTINGLSLRVKCLDFVVFTGDFGLEDADPAKSAAEVATFFRALSTKEILLVPGNNDLKNEDPRDVVRFRSFVDELARLLPEHQVVDVSRTSETVNGIHIVGMNSATFKNDGGALTASNAADQLTEMRRVDAEVQGAGSSIIFTHIPNLEDPYRGDDNKARGAWNVSPDILRLWQKIIKNDQVLAVFAGHFHDARPEIYRQDYGWAEKKPSRVEGKKTWVAPPLAVKFQSEAKTQARGLFLVTVTKGGTVEVLPKWFTYSDSAAVPDKGDELFQAETELSYGRWNEALASYRKALVSSDSGVRGKAELGYARARKGIYSDLWLWRILKAVLLVALLAVAFGLCEVIRRIAKRNRSQGRIVIEMPARLTQDAPVEFFSAALVCAANEIQSIYRSERDRGNASPAEESTSYSFSLLSGAEDALKEITSSLPDVHGVKVGKLINALPFLYRFFVKWRIESGLGTPDANQAYGYSSLRWRSTATAAWVESAVVLSTTNPQEPGPSLLIRSLAWKLASDILSKNITNNAS
jgi:hypothetical protein